jgi:hypothetical protein
VPSWALVVLGAVALVLPPWTFYLGERLPSKHVARHWDIAWTGFDIGLALVLIATIVAALRRSDWLEGFAMAAAAMLVCDAWFDILTSATRNEVIVAAVEAAAAELPVAVVCVVVARDATRYRSRSRTAAKSR